MAATRLDAGRGRHPTVWRISRRSTNPTTGARVDLMDTQSLDTEHISCQARRTHRRELPRNYRGPKSGLRGVTADGANRDELLPAIADVSAILIRSATKVDAGPSRPPTTLKGGGQGRVGLDNVDVPAATQRG